MKGFEFNLIRDNTAPKQPQRQMGGFRDSELDAMEVAVKNHPEIADLFPPSTSTFWEQDIVKQDLKKIQGRLRSPASYRKKYVQIQSDFSSKRKRDAPFLAEGSDTLKVLLDMGFSDKEGLTALSNTSGGVDEAVEWLMANNIDREDEDVAGAPVKVRIKVKAPTAVSPKQQAVVPTPAPAPAVVTENKPQPTPAETNMDARVKHVGPYVHGALLLNWSVEQKNMVGIVAPQAVKEITETCAIFGIQYHTMSRDAQTALVEKVSRKVIIEMLKK